MLGAVYRATQIVAPGDYLSVAQGNSANRKVQGCSPIQRASLFATRLAVFTASHNGREYARRHIVPLEGRCAYAFSGDAMLLMSQVRRVTSALWAIVLADLRIVKWHDSQCVISLLQVQIKILQQTS